MRRKTSVLKSLFNKEANLKKATLKAKLGFSPVNIVKVFKTAILKNGCF